MCFTAGKHKGASEFVFCTV